MNFAPKFCRALIRYCFIVVYPYFFPSLLCTFELCARIYVIYICIIAVRLRSDIALCWTSDAVYALGLLVLSYLYLKRADWQSKRI